MKSKKSSTLKERHSSSGSKSSKSTRDHTSRKKSKSQRSKSGHSEEDTGNRGNSPSLTEPDGSILEQLPLTCRPLRCFVEDKDKLMEQLFATIGEDGVQKLVPKSLKSYSLHEIKELCFEQLKLMTSEAILHILSGGDPAILLKDKHDETTESPPPNIIEVQEQTFATKIDENIGESLAFPNVEEDVPFVATPIHHDGGNEGTVAIDPIPEADDNLMKDKGNEDSLAETEKYDSNLCLKSLGVRNESPKDLELLELELRAKAIRSLLKAKGLQSSSDDDLGVSGEDSML